MKVRRFYDFVRARTNFLMLCALVTLAFLIGGGSRADTTSLILLWPLAGIAFAAGIWGLSADTLRQFPVVIAMLTAAVLITVIQLVPLPPALWSALPGRDLALEVARAAGLSDAWQPISLTPFRTMASLYAILVPSAIALWGMRCTPEERAMLLPVLIVIGSLSALIGLMQALGSSQSSLYFYRLSSRGYAVGLFANRNHQAVFLCCLFPILAIYASTAIRTIEQGRFRLQMSGALAAILIPLVLVTGSRAGLILMLLAIVLSVLLYRPPAATVPPKRRGGRRSFAPVYWGAGALALVVLTYASSRATAVQRLFAGAGEGDDRLSTWGPILDLTLRHFPFGSGAGSFVETYQVDEPTELLSPQYLNHAHNDWLEVSLTHGLPGMILLVVAVMLWLLAARSLFLRPHTGSRSIIFGRLGLVLIAVLGLASVVDYPLRVPSLAALLVIAALWAEEGAARARILARDRTNTPEKGGTLSAAAIARPAHSIS